MPVKDSAQLDVSRPPYKRNYYKSYIILSSWQHCNATPYERLCDLWILLISKEKVKNVTMMRDLSGIRKGFSTISVRSRVIAKASASNPALSWFLEYFIHLLLWTLKLSRITTSAFGNISWMQFFEDIYRQQKNLSVLNTFKLTTKYPGHRVLCCFLVVGMINRFMCKVSVHSWIGICCAICILDRADESYKTLV